MAKATKSGLGRGLNSLLGGSYEESAPAEAPRSRQRVVVEAGEIGSYDLIIEPRRPEPSRERAAEEAASEKTKEENVSRETFSIPTEDVEIKGVTERTPQEIPRVLDEVPIDQVVPNPDQPRTNFKQEQLDELAASIRKDGLLQPILVRRIGLNSYQIIAGERRWQACKMVGLEKVPIRIKDVDDGKALELALIENIQRADLNPIEEAYGYRRMMERNDMTQLDVAKAMSKGRSTVANALRLLELPEEAQRLLYEEKITAGHARAILSIPTKEGKDALTKKLVEMKLTVRETETLARLLSGKKNDVGDTPRQGTPDSFKKVAKTLRDILHTNVRVKTAKGKNKIEIEFKDEEELHRLFEEIIASAS